MEYRPQLELPFLSPTLFLETIPATSFSLSTLVSGNYLLRDAGKETSRIHYHQQLLTSSRKTTDRIKPSSILV